MQIVYIQWYTSSKKSKLQQHFSQNLKDDYNARYLLGAFTIQKGKLPSLSGVDTQL